MSDSAEAFIQKIDDWMVNSGFLSHDIDIGVVESILSKDHSQSTYAELTSDTIYMYRYLDSLQASHSKELSIVEFCKSSILYLCSELINDSGNTYTKYELKYNMGLKKDQLSKKLFSLMLNSESKVIRSEKRIDHIKRICDIMSDVLKRKNYEHG